MRTLALPALVAALAAAPALADTVKCRDGRSFRGDPLDAPCTQACPNGGWDLLGGDCHPERVRRVIRARPPTPPAPAPASLEFASDPLRERCASLWPGDFALQETCEGDLLEQMARVPSSAPNGLGDPFEQEVRLFCLDESFLGRGQVDYARAARCVSEQKEAARRLDLFVRSLDGPR